MFIYQTKKRELYYDCIIGGLRNREILDES